MPVLVAFECCFTDVVASKSSYLECYLLAIQQCAGRALRSTAAPRSTFGRSAVDPFKKQSQAAQHAKRVLFDAHGAHLICCPLSPAGVVLDLPSLGVFSTCVCVVAVRVVIDMEDAPDSNDGGGYEYDGGQEYDGGDNRDDVAEGRAADDSTDAAAGGSTTKVEDTQAGMHSVSP